MSSDNENLASTLIDRFGAELVATLLVRILGTLANGAKRTKRILGRYGTTKEAIAYGAVMSFYAWALLMNGERQVAEFSVVGIGSAGGLVGLQYPKAFEKMMMLMLVVSFIGMTMAALNFIHVQSLSWTSPVAYTVYWYLACAVMVFAGVSKWERLEAQRPRLRKAVVRGAVLVFSLGVLVVPTGFLVGNPTLGWYLLAGLLMVFAALAVMFTVYIAVFAAVWTAAVSLVVKALGPLAYSLDRLATSRRTVTVIALVAVQFGRRLAATQY